MPPREQDFADRVNNIARALLQGASLGYGDEITAATQFAQPYDKVLQREREAQALFHQQHPYVDTGLQMTGSLLPSAATGLGIAAAAPRIGATLATLGGVGAEGAAMGFGSGEGGFGPRAKNAAIAAALSEVLAGGAMAAKSPAVRDSLKGIAGDETGAISFIKKYYPREYAPIHEVDDWSKVRSIMRSAMKGDEIPPILVDGTKGNGSLLTGTHRQAANEILDKLGKSEDSRIPVTYLSELKSLVGAKKAKAVTQAAENGDFEAIDRILDRSSIKKTQ